MRGAKRIAPVLRLTATAVMLAVLVSRVDLGRVVPRWRPVTAAWLAAAALVTVLGIVLSALRWQRVLATLGLPARLGTLLGHSLAGLFVGNFLPSTIGGDVVRVGRLAASNGETPATFASVVLERLTGWLVLPLLSLLAVALNPGLLRTPRWELLPTLSFVTLGLLVALLVVAGNERLGRRLGGSDGWLRFVAALHLGVSRFRRAPGAILEVLVVGFAYQVVVVLAAFLAAKALGIPASWSAMLAVMPAVAMLQVLPVTVGGLGVREGALVLFLAHVELGVRAEQAVALGLLVYGLNLLASLMGAPAFAFGSRPARSQSATAPA